MDEKAMVAIKAGGLRLSKIESKNKSQRLSIN
jgi:hypothetical protein